MKDLKLVFRDRAAIILMLLAPFALTLGLGLVTGGFSSANSGGISQIPMVLVNHDEGLLGQELLNVFLSPGLSEVVEVDLLTDADAARKQVDANEIAAVILIPTGFTASVIPDPITGNVGVKKDITLYANPSRPTSGGVIQSIVEQFLNEVEVRSVAGQVTITQLIRSGRIQPQGAAQTAQLLAQEAAPERQVILRGVLEQNAPQQFNVMAYMAPGMALMFLMFTVSNGGRSLLVEKTQGTLPRLLVTPLKMNQVLLGKMTGTFMTGSLQMLILILTSSLLFRLQWGQPVAIIVLVLSAVVGAIGWGMVLTALVKTPAQASNFGMTTTLIFGVLGGSFFELSFLPKWLQVFSKVTPNAWGIEGFIILATGGGIEEIMPDVIGLLVMGAVLLAVSLFLFKRQGGFQA